ncbi:hypothetical protein LY78DRAFT_670164 [Colletotrichum sublineola]|nr:hypothetical protein LY78DRAFT_670164 [Colletotrichum sublineola]
MRTVSDYEDQKDILQKIEQMEGIPNVDEMKDLVDERNRELRLLPGETLLDKMSRNYSRFDDRTLWFVYESDAEGFKLRLGSMAEDADKEGVHKVAEIARRLINEYLKDLKPGIAELGTAINSARDAKGCGPFSPRCYSPECDEGFEDFIFESEARVTPEVDEEEPQTTSCPGNDNGDNSDQDGNSDLENKHHDMIQAVSDEDLQELMETHYPEMSLNQRANLKHLYQLLAADKDCLV